MKGARLPWVLSAVLLFALWGFSLRHCAAADSPSPASAAGSISSLSQRAQLLMTAASLLILTALAASFLPLVGDTIGMVLAGAAAALAAVATLLGILVMTQHGQLLHGAMFTAMGALLTYCVFKAAREYERATECVPSP